MRFFRLMAIGIVLLVLAGAILGSACTGARGEQGPQGEIGATGATGPAGPQGEQGIQGIQGIQGVQGEKGDTGLPGAGVAWQGEWSNSMAYSLNDGVGYQGSSYISRQNDNTSHMPTDTDWWDLWVGKGDAGDTGPQGMQGIQGIPGASGAAGAQGPQGVQGATGATGATGPAGPNMIVAMGNIAANAAINQGYHVTSCIYDLEYHSYYINLTGITFSSVSYMTVVTPVYSSARYAIYWNNGGILAVTLYDSAGNYAQGGFSFIVLDATP